MNLLIVEDEVQLADALAEILQRNKYHVDTVYNGEDGLHYASTGIYDCIVLDIMLPILDGISVLRMLRKQKISTPVLLLTAKSDVADKINGLDSGADDYLTKPFVTGELLARIRALTRRTGEVAVDGLQFHNLRLDSQNYTLSYGQEQIKLSLKEYQIMEIFMSNPKQIVSKEFFIEKIWGYERMLNTTISKCIFHSCGKNCSRFTPISLLKPLGGLAIFWRNSRHDSPCQTPFYLFHHVHSDRSGSATHDCLERHSGIHVL